MTVVTKNLWINAGIFWLLGFALCVTIIVPMRNIHLDSYTIYALIVFALLNAVLAFIYVGLTLIIKRKVAKADSIWLLPLYCIVIWAVAVLVISIVFDDKPTFIF